MSDEVSPAKGVSGKKSIVVIGLVALAFASFGWWWRLREAAPARDLWGSAHVIRIRDAARVDVFKLTRQEDLAPTPGKPIPSETFLVRDTWYAVTESADARAVLGVNDFRRVLLADFGYDWKADLSACTPRWEFAVRWTSGSGDQTTLLYAPNCHRLHLLETDAEASIEPSASFAESFIKRSLGIETKAPK